MGHSRCDMERTECGLADVVQHTEEIYANGKIPLICAVEEDKAEALTTFWTYASGCTTVECKPLVGMAMNEGKAKCWDRIATAAVGAMKCGNTLTLLMRDGCPDLAGMAKEAGREEAFTALFTADVPKTHTSFPGLDLEPGDVREEFKVVVVSKFLAEDIEDFFGWGPIPMDSCHLLVVNS